MQFRHRLLLLAAGATVFLPSAVLPRHAAAASTAPAFRYDIHVNGTHVCTAGGEFPQFTSSPAVGDLYHDGGREIVEAFPDGHVRAYRASDAALLWDRDTGDMVSASPTLADLDNNGRLWVIVPSWSGWVNVWDPWGNERAGWPRHSLYGHLPQVSPAYYSSAAVGDVYGDGRKEIFASALDLYTYGWNADGSLLPNWPRVVYDSAFATPALADLEHQHRLDIVTPSDASSQQGVNGHYWAWRPDGSLLFDHPVDTTPWASPLIDNFGDGNFAIDNGTAPFTGGGHYVLGLNQNGGTRGGFPYATGAGSLGSPASGDLYGDGQHEIVHETADGMLQGLTGSGQTLLGFPVTLPNPPAPASRQPAYYLGGPVIAPVDSAGRNGIWAPAAYTVSGFDVAPGGVTQVATLATPGIGYASPTVADLGGGHLSLLAASEDTSQVCGQAGSWHITVWTLPGTGAAMPGGAWPTFHGNMARSGSNLGLGPPPQHGYWLVASDGGIFPFGSAPGYGSTGGIHLNQPIVGMARTPDGGGYWLVASDGGIFPFGDAVGYGSTGNIHLHQPIVGIAAVPHGRGYYMVASDGGIFPFGPDAVGYGSTGNIRLNQPIVGMTVTPDGGGYWLVASDGGIFPFGDAPGYGSTGGIRLNQPIVGMAANPQGGGYWMVASDGGIFPFGPNAPGYGSTGNIRLNQPIVAMAVTDDGRGYYMVASDGGIFPFGPSAGGYGSVGGLTLAKPIVGMAVTR
ncbi:MAG TPA: hypothetical protein VG266_07035 [Candidatus Dormibacteraeota bacterium]|nr:hypothetical protein [Candidatus Dormibacteraeota bacterium]